MIDFVKLSRPLIYIKVGQKSITKNSYYSFYGLPPSSFNSMKIILYLDHYVIWCKKWCTKSMLPSRNSRYWNQWSAELRLKERDWLLKRCIHYYACICAFASDQKLRDEFRLESCFSLSIHITPASVPSPAIRSYVTSSGKTLFLSHHPNYACICAFASDQKLRDEFR